MTVVVSTAKWAKKRLCLFADNARSCDIYRTFDSVQINLFNFNSSIVSKQFLQRLSLVLAEQQFAGRVRYFWFIFEQLEGCTARTVRSRHNMPCLASCLMATFGASSFLTASRTLNIALIDNCTFLAKTARVFVLFSNKISNDSVFCFHRLTGDIHRHSLHVWVVSLRILIRCVVTDRLAFTGARLKVVNQLCDCPHRHLGLSSLILQN